MRNYRFGALLSEGLISVARRWGKTKAGVEQDIYEQLTATGIPLKETTIRGWCRGFVPHDPSLVAWVVRYCVEHGRIDQRWADSLLFHAGYPERQALLDRLFSGHPDQPEQPQKKSKLPALQVEDPLLPPLPFPSRRLVGRAEHLQRVISLFQEGEPLLVLQGLPGVGKTTLALALAHHPTIRERFPDGVLWAGLGQQPDVRSVLAHWGSVLHVGATEMSQLADLQALARAIRGAIGQRRMLLVIDDAWGVEAALACQVGGQGCAHLVTTRLPGLALQLTGPALVQVPELNDTDGLRLLTQFAPDVVNAEPQEAQALVQAVGGLPLALVLLGRYLQREAHSNQPRRLHAALDRVRQRAERLRVSQSQTLLNNQSALPHGTTLSLEASIDASYHTLSPRARSVLLALAIFPPKPNTFSEEAALAVAAATPAMLDLLLDTGLLESSGAGRYVLHQTIVDFARLKRLGQQPKERFITFFARYAIEHQEDYTALDREAHNLLTALPIAVDLERQADLLQTTNALAPFLIARGLYDIAKTYLTHAQKAATETQDCPRLITTLLYLGRVLERYGDYVQAETVLQKGLTLARQRKDPSSLIDLLATLAPVVYAQGNYSMAEALWQEGLARARKQNNETKIGELLRYLGNLAGNSGNLAQAEIYYQEALTLARKAGQGQLIYRPLMGLAILFAEQGDYVKAETSFLESLALAREEGVMQSICVILSNLGELYTTLKRYDEAYVLMEEGLALARKIEHRQYSCLLLQNLALLAYGQGAYTQAETYARESILLAEELKHPRRLSISLIIQGKIFLKAQQRNEAEEAFKRALETAREMGDQIRQGRALFGLAQVAAAQNDVTRAHNYGEQSVVMLEAIGQIEKEEVAQWLALLPSSDTGIG